MREPRRASTTARQSWDVQRSRQQCAAAISLHFMHYNFARPHKTLSDPYPRTPSMAAGVADHIWKLEETTRTIG